MFVGECAAVECTQEFFRDEHVDNEEVTHENYVNVRRRSLVREAALVRRHLPAGGRLIDVGTASGYFLQQFAGDEKWEVEGVEPSKASCRYARQTFGLKIHEGYLPDQKFDEAAFEVVTSLDSFNCHREPRQDMQEFFRILKPGGILAMEVGGQRFRLLTGSGLFSRLVFGKSLRLNAGVNYFYYNRDTLTRLAAMAGFEPVESYPEAMPDPGSRLKRLFRDAYFHASAAVYRLSGGRWNLAPKEFFIFRKPHRQPALSVYRPDAVNDAA